MWCRDRRSTALWRSVEVFGIPRVAPTRCWKDDLKWHLITTAGRPCQRGPLLSLKRGLFPQRGGFPVSGRLRSFLFPFCCVALGFVCRCPYRQTGAVKKIVDRGN